MRLNVIAISIEDPADHVVGAVLSELLNMTFGDGELTPPLPPHEGIDGATPRAGTAPPSPSLAAAAGTPGPGEPRPPARAAAVRDEAKTQASVPAKPKPGMLATEQERKHFQNMHGADAKTQREDRVVKPGELPAALRSLTVGEEFIIRPAPKYMNGISRHVNHLRARGEIDRRIAVARDADGEVRVIFHSEQQA